MFPVTSTCPIKKKGSFVALLPALIPPPPSMAMVSVSGQQQLGSQFPSSNVREQSRPHLQIIV